MEIVKADISHLPAIAALEAQCFPGDAWPPEVIARLRERFTVALEGETVAGYLVLSSVLDEGSIDNVAVAPALRRRGIADALVADAAARGRAMGLSTLTLEVRAGNAPAVALYEKHGFSAVGLRRGYYERPREDAILMTKVL